DRDFDYDRALLRTRIDTHHVPIYDTVAGIDRCLLRQRDVLRLRLRNPEHGLETARLRDARDLETGIHPLAELERERQQNAVLARDNVHRVHAIALLRRD